MTSEATLLTREELKLAGFVEHQLPTPLKQGEQKRWLYVPKDIEALLCDGSKLPTGHTHAMIGSFLKGNILLVTRRRPKKKKDDDPANFKRLEDHDEAWVMAFTKPKQEQWRLFGRFADKDLFVGLLLKPRKELWPEERYQEAAEEMIASWSFEREPLRSEELEDYFSGTIIDKDKI